LMFGTLGYLVGHELLHGFDDLGRDFDISGIERNWWDSNSTIAFEERKECFKDQYARYRFGGKYLPKSEFQSENIADNGGLHLTYGAYMDWLKNTNASNKTDAEVLPNMPYTNRQLFFIGFGQFWCDDVNEHFKDKVALTDDHSPAMFRVIGTLANFDEFSKEFKCLKGSTMNPEKKCLMF